jgi:hypothetical protein
MTTIVNGPRGTQEDSSISSILVLLFVLLVVGFLFFTYALPAIRSMTAPQEQQERVDVNVSIPNEFPTGSGPSSEAEPTLGEPAQPAS